MLIRGGRLVDPSLPLDALRDLRIRDGIVVEIGEALAPRDDELVLEAENAVVAPGFIDMHVHLREPGNPEKETIATGTEAALRGGFTAVACMPNTQPALDSAERLAELARALARSARVRVYPVAAITQARRGEAPTDYRALARAGAVAFSDDGASVDDPAVLRAAALAALEVPGVFISHCEDARLKGSGVMTDGVVARSLGVAGSPRIAEDIVVARDLAIAAATGKAFHIAHLSTAGALDYVRHARAHGGRATCEVTPHHLLLTDAAIASLGAGAKVNPPLRRDEDVAALRAGVRDGTIDAFATDHAPHTAAEKRAALDCAAVGFSGLEIAVGAYAQALPDLDLLRFVALLSTNPARILDVPGGTLALGSPGDVTVFAERAWTVDPAAFASLGKSTPFAGWRLPRRVVATVVGGELRYRG